VSGDGDELDDENARLHRLSTPTSLDRTVGDDDSNELVDLLADEANPSPETMLIDSEHSDWLHGLLDVLDPRARSAVEQRFGMVDGTRRSYREVGEDLGITAEAARRLVKRAVNTVREQALATAL
jgi:RNA polymerase primary sigma factor